MKDTTDINRTKTESVKPLSSFTELTLKTKSMHYGAGIGERPSLGRPSLHLTSRIDQHSKSPIPKSRIPTLRGRMR